MALHIQYYQADEAQEWDDFVLNKSMNGTFLQTRKFIEYHAPGKFQDRSLCVRKGNELVAALLACEINDDGLRTFFAHKGSTYGGICISKKIYSATAVSELMELLETFLRAEGFEKVYLKMVPPIFQRENTDLLDYFLYKQGFFCYNELNYYMHLDRYQQDVLSQFSSSKRRDYRYSLHNDLRFQKLETPEEISAFYDVLQLNLKKLNLPSVHSLEDLQDLYFHRFPSSIAFYGVFWEDQLIAGSMLFLFGEDIVHTQYLSSDEAYLKLYPMDFLIGNLIQLAVDQDKRLFTFGICTENQGRYLNLGLSRFKEGFGTEFCINRSYEKVLSSHQEDMSC